MIDSPSIFGSATNTNGSVRPRNRLGAGAEFGELGGVESVVQGQHRHAVTDFGEPGFRRPANSGRWRVGPDQPREAGLDLGIAAAEGIVVSVGNLRRVMGVVGGIVVRDLMSQTGKFFRGFHLGQGTDLRLGTLPRQRSYQQPLRRPLAT